MSKLKKKKQTAKFDMDNPKLKIYLIAGIIILAAVSIAIGMGAAS